MWSGYIPDTLQEGDVELRRLLRPETATQITVKCCIDNRDHVEWLFLSTFMPLLRYTWCTQ